MTKKDISCYGLTDGGITADVTGGTGTNYSYTWEMYVGSSWNTLSAGTAGLSGSIAGDYRVRVRDVRNCASVSDVVTIMEPTVLTLPRAAVHDIKCLGEKGSLSLEPMGGTAPYTWQYALKGSDYTTFTADTPLTAGAYAVRVLDRNNCAEEYADALVLTTPESALDFGYVQSDYNGFNISCVGGANGYVELRPSGGNGGVYGGYQYALDGGTYQANARLEGIAAGSHQVTVQDARGCEISKAIAFSQATEKISVTEKSHADVACYGDVTGSLEVQGAGGVGPYVYSLNGGSSQATPVFAGLGVGDYRVVLTDLNGCATVSSFGISSINPVMSLISSVTDVSCYQGKNGAVSLSVSGGVQPLRYAWSGGSSTGDVLRGVSAGNYVATVTDAAGCVMKATASVAQPARAVSLSAATVPVCFGSTAGSVTASAQGGTLPYLFSSDGGKTYQDSPVFDALAIGSYAIRVKDNQGCEEGMVATVVQRKDKPEPDFIVATQEHALDTLVVTDISVPKPDSIVWSFDSRAHVLDANAWQPKIKFDGAGTYVVGMAGYFGGCVYTVDRTLSINPYDPEQVKTLTPSYKAIKSVEVTPNPNNGQFTVHVSLNYKHRVSLIVYDVSGVARYNNAWASTDGITEVVNLGSVSSGVYLVRVVTNSEAEDVRIIVTK